MSGTVLGTWDLSVGKLPYSNGDSLTIPEKNKKIRVSFD